MQKFDFLIGSWKLKYTIPASRFSEAGTGEGEGIFSRVLKDNYVVFDYRADLTTGSAQAHVIYAKDKEQDEYRCWWFEDTGNYETASCRFVDEKLLFLSWHGTSLIQTFQQTEKDHVVLTMSDAAKKDKYEMVLMVDMFKQS